MLKLKHYELLISNEDYLSTFAQKYNKIVKRLKHNLA